MSLFDATCEWVTPVQLRLPVVNALTIDFEDWYHGLEIPCSHWSGFGRRLEASGHHLLDLLDDARCRATFFVLGWVAEHYPDLVRTIAARGHEIGTHGYGHMLVYQQSPDVLRHELRRSIDMLQQVTGVRVLGHRAPYFSITEDALWVLELLGELGIMYDSSIFPVHNYRYGIHYAPRWPFMVNAGEQHIVEFPLSVWRFAGQNVPMAGGAYFRMFPYAWTRWVFQAINALGYPAVFYLHPWELDPHHPRISLPRRIAMTHYFNLGATEPRLRQLLRDFAFAPMIDVLAQSTLRDALRPLLPETPNGA